MSPRSGAPGLRAARFLLIAGMLVFSAFWSARAPFGAWTNQVFGTPVWGEEDPGAYYVASAHELAWGEPPLFVGHPGATLTPLLRGVQVALYGLLADEGVTFTRFTAQHIDRVFVLSKLLATGLHVLSFLVLLRLARAVLGDARAAELAVLGYATSLPVLYYLSRISVEPLMVMLFAGSLLAVFRWEERVRDGGGAALAWAALAGVASVAGALSKLSFLGPLPFFCGLQLAVGGPAAGRAVRARGLIAFGVAGLVALGLFSQIIDWGEFWLDWTRIVEGASPPGLGLSALWPGLGGERIFLASEGPFLACALAGVVGFLRDPGAGSRRRAGWLLAYGGLATALFAYRVHLHGSFLPFHYFFLSQATLAVFFGAFAARWAGRLGARGWRGALLCVGAMALLHGLAVLAVIDSRRADARAYAGLEPVYALVSQLGPGERVGVERRDPRALAFGQHGFRFPTFFRDRPSRLQRELEALFVTVPVGSTRASPSRRHAPALSTYVAIVPADPTR